MKVCVTGGAGFIGSHVVELLQGRARITVLDDFSTGKRENLDGLDVRIVEGSILDHGAVREAVADADWVFHLAAMVSVPQSMAEPARCVEVNTIGTINVLEEAANAGVRRLCFASSAAVYGNDPTVPKREEMRPAPCSPYGITKLSGEYFCELFAETGRLSTAALRFFNVFGPRQDPNSPYAAAVPIFIRQALRNEPITIFGDGRQTRDFIFVRDIARALVFFAERPDKTGVYNAAYGGRLTVIELAERILRLTGSRADIRFGPPRPGDVRHSTADVRRILDAGFRPESDLDSGLRETIAWFREQYAGEGSTDLPDADASSHGT